LRLSKIKLAGFKSFVDPTTVQLPSNLTGVVGPNGCGKSNVIDAVRWVMGELSAKHLRGDSMADVVFNGSSSRKPLGAASVELVFDNSDGKIGGAYAGFTEISLKRQVSRDGSSGYFINGGRCRRKDITQLFLGTGLGSRSYAIIEQGMISRVVEARADDMRAFIEEAAGISLYKERRRETESRIADARENLARVQDLRDEVDKQLRHLQRQATATRKYQEFKSLERQLTAELIVLRMRALESGADVQDSAMRATELSMQQALADQRSEEAAIEKQRAFHLDLSSALSLVQGRYYEIGSEITRTEENIRFTTELRSRQRSDLTQTQDGLRAVVAQVASDQDRLHALQQELLSLNPDADRLRGYEDSCAATLATAEAEMNEWQVWWEHFNSQRGAATQSMQVEIARSEQLEAQLLRLRAHADRLAIERDNLGQQQADAPLSSLSERESAARQLAQSHADGLSALMTRLGELRGQQRAAEIALEAERGRRERARTELLALEALQKAALSEKDARAAAWIESLPGVRQRLAESLVVDSGWERAVETVLGDYLEALCVDALEQVAAELGRLGGGSVNFVEAGTAVGPGARAGSLASRVRGPAAIVQMLETVVTCDTLGEALSRRGQLSAQQSLVTAGGEWVGSNWLRVRRGGEPRAGVLEREHRLKQLRESAAVAESGLRDATSLLEQLREQVMKAEHARDAAQSDMQHGHAAHSELRSQLDVLRARLEEADARRTRVATEAHEVEVETGRARQGLETAATTRAAAVESLRELDERRPELEQQRQLRQQRFAAARAAAQTAQRELRDVLVLLESRRTAELSMQSGVERLLEQQRDLESRRAALDAALADGDQPIGELQQRLDAGLAQRLEVEAELANARRNLEEADFNLRELELKRGAAEQRVADSRTELERARLAAQESRLRRESLLEQFTATHCDLPTVNAGLAAEAAVEPWEVRLREVVADIEKLGAVNLAAIDELKEQSERKQYLDRQYTDVNDALQTLEDAMRKIEKETRTRFEDTFNRVNAGLQDKFPRLFGGGHAYLEMEGDDPLQAGVAVMARPPGKRNSTISQLSGGEKALTAVALVFSIFDLNPAPFCLLDEVDAPLDEHNVGRFCDIVQEMSSRVQFIFITHNKTTMELASQLIGVTMNEPGVSRLVAVDVDEAVRMAAV
jgi:chromosome segregation protein